MAEEISRESSFRQLRLVIIFIFALDSLICYRSPTHTPAHTEMSLIYKGASVLASKDAQAIL